LGSDLGSDEIRNVVLVGHSGSGKTALTEALLHATGVTTRMGRVEDGNTTTDFEPEEISRGSSVSLAMAPFGWKGHEVNVIDTPGYSDFLGEVRAALRAADLALFVVSAVDGVEVQTEAVWHMAEEERIARAFFINKLDRERASYARTLGQIKDHFGTAVAPLQVPIGTEHELSGVVNLVDNVVFTYDGKPGGTKGEMPESVAGEITGLRTALIEAAVETDDELLEQYLEGVEPGRDQLVAAIHEGLITGAAFPVLCGSATKLVGIDRLVEFIIDYGPRPDERPDPPLVDGEIADGDTVAYVFKTQSDPYVGRISLFRVFRGSVKLDADLQNPARNASSRMHNLFSMRGKEHADVTEVPRGGIAAVAKLESTLAGDTLRSAKSSAVIEPVAMPRPTMSVAVFPKSQQDEEKLSTALQRVVEDDPTLSVERRADTRQTVISGLGDAHLEVVISRLSSRFGVEVETGLPKIPYRETIRGRTNVEGKHKKQSGGRGQFGVAYVRFEPMPAGTGYEFVDEVKGGNIPRQYIPAVDKGIREALQRGILAGYPVVDVKATVYDGKHHSVDSDELSFRMAGIQAVRAASPSLNAALLEPIMRITVRVPEDQTGDVIGDLNAKRGRVLGMDSDGGLRVITAEVPLAEIQRYSIDLRSLTSGRGSFEMQMSHYEEAPPQEAQRVIAAAEAEKED